MTVSQFGNKDAIISLAAVLKQDLVYFPDRSNDRVWTSCLLQNLLHKFKKSDRVYKQSSIDSVDIFFAQSGSFKRQRIDSITVDWRLFICVGDYTWNLKMMRIQKGFIHPCLQRSCWQLSLDWSFKLYVVWEDVWFFKHFFGFECNAFVLLYTLFFWCEVSRGRSLWLNLHWFLRKIFAYGYIVLCRWLVELFCTWH